MDEIALYDDGVAVDEVRLQRAAGSDRILLMSGRTTSYSVDPRGEYIFGVVGHQPMRSRRGRERRTAVPGQLVAWDPTSAHSGTAASGQAWTSRLLVVETADLLVLADDLDRDPLTNLVFPQPVITDGALAQGFLRLHAALGSPSTLLEADDLLAEWLQGLVDRWSATRHPEPPKSATPRDDRALRLALTMMAEHATDNIRLDDLAGATGVSKFRLVRLFRERTGLPPHALQIAHRIRLARRLLEGGTSVADTAVATGFTDQSHLHRHFRRTLGMTPLKYQQRVRNRP